MVFNFRTITQEFILEKQVTNKQFHAFSLWQKSGLNMQNEGGTEF